MKEKNRTVQDEARIQLMNDAYNNNNQRQMFQNQEDLKKTWNTIACDRKLAI